MKTLESDSSYGTLQKERYGCRELMENGFIWIWKMEEHEVRTEQQSIQEESVLLAQNWMSISWKSYLALQNN